MTGGMATPSRLTCPRPLHYERCCSARCGIAPIPPSARAEEPRLALIVEEAGTPEARVSIAGGVLGTLQDSLRIAILLDGRCAIDR